LLEVEIIAPSWKRYFGLLGRARLGGIYPQNLGKWYTTYTRFNRWAKKGVWPGVVSALQSAGCQDFTFDAEGLHWAPAGELSDQNDLRKTRASRAITP